MPDPVAFASASPRFGLPFLYAGQSQKELHVNEAHALVDALLHCVIEGESAAPPTTPAEGTAWLVATGPSGDWTGHAGQLACRQAGQWLFVAPRDGLRLFDRGAGREMRYLGGWLSADRPAAPSGGTVIDSEARAAIAALVDALSDAGIIPPD